MVKSKTQQVRDLLNSNPGMSARKASKLVGISEGVVSRALKIDRDKAATRALFEQGGHRVPD